MLIKCTAIFDFDNNNSIDQEICKNLNIPHSTMTVNLNDSQYNELCENYNTPRLDEEFYIEINDNNINDASIIANAISDNFGWLVTSFSYNENK